MVLSFGLSIVLALAHLYAHRLRFLQVQPRSRWLSFAGGSSVAYVFVHLLPELGEWQEVLGDIDFGVLEWLDRHAYLLALCGLVAFYGLEKVARRGGGQREKKQTSSGSFWLHVGAFSLYNAIIGYLLLDTAWPTQQRVLFALAMGLHFFVTDYGLREAHRHLYLRKGRWLLSGAILFGSGVGALTEVPESAVLFLAALLSGGIILNVLKEELPEERESRFSAFFLGALLYTALLLAL